jgi:hypothetical protein
VETCTVTALDAITAFAVPNPNCTSQSRRFFQVWLLFGLPRGADHSAYFGLARFYLSQPFQPSTNATLEICLKIVNARWSKLSEGFVRWIRKGEVRENSFAAQCYRKQSVPDQLAPVPASAWLHEKGLREGAQIWEQSVGLKRYGAVLSLLVIIEAVEKGR